MTGPLALAASGEMLLDQHPANDNEHNAGSDPLAPEAADMAAYHHVGRTLIERAAREGHGPAAIAAAEIFRAALARFGKAAPPPLHNGLGAALVEVARVGRAEVAASALAEAISEFQLACEGTDPETLPAAHKRYEINRATAKWMQAEQSGDHAQIRMALGDLEFDC